MSLDNISSCPEFSLQEMETAQSLLDVWAELSDLPQPHPTQLPPESQSVSQSLEWLLQVLADLGNQALQDES